MHFFVSGTNTRVNNMAMRTQLIMCTSKFIGNYLYIYARAVGFCAWALFLGWAVHDKNAR